MKFDQDSFNDESKCYSKERPSSIINKFEQQQHYKSEPVLIVQ